MLDHMVHLFLVFEEPLYCFSFWLHQRLEISSRKLEIPREHFMQRWAQERTEMGGA